MDTSITSNAEIDKWVDRIHVAWGKTVQGIIETGREFINAKAAVGPEDFLKVIERSKFSVSSVKQLMLIASNEVLISQSYHGNLPSSWRTLYELTKLGDNLQVAIDQGRITPELQRNQVKQLVHSYEQPSPVAAEPTPDKPVSKAESDNSDSATNNKAYPQYVRVTQEQFDAAVQRGIDEQFRKAVNARVKEFLADTIGPKYQKDLDEAQRIIKSRKGIMHKRTFRLIVSCLHPDKFDHLVNLIKDAKTEQLSEIKHRHSDAFRMFNQLEKFLLDEKESPTQLAPPLPKTAAEWEEQGRQAAAARKAKRAATTGGIQPK